METDNKMKALLIEINHKYTAIVEERAEAEGLTGVEVLRLITHHACLGLATVIRVGIKADLCDSFIQGVFEQIKVDGTAMAKIKRDGGTTNKVILALELANKWQQFSLFVAQDFFVEHSD